VDFDYFSQLCNPQSNSGPDVEDPLVLSYQLSSLEQPAKENV